MMQIQAVLFVLFLHTIFSEYVPHFVTHRNKLSNEILPESSKVDLIPDKTSGSNLFTWSAVFTSYHRAVIREQNDWINALCQTEETNNLIKSVTYFFTAKSGTNKGLQTLILTNENQSTSYKWPLYTSIEIAGSYSNVLFNQSYGADMMLKFESASDISGLLQCQVETMFGLIMKSNLLEIIDIRKEIAGLLPVASIKDGSFASSGYSTFKAVQGSTKRDDMETVVKTVPVVIRWDIYIESKKGDYVINQYLYPNMRSMKQEDLGSYVIDNYGNLYINMNSQKANQVRSKIMGTEGEWSTKNIRLVLLMSDTTQRIGFKFHAKEDMATAVAVQSLPVRIVPLSGINDVVTYVGNMGDNLLCGFLFNGSNYEIIWKFNNEIKNKESLLTEFGMKVSGAGTMLDMLDVKIDASGLWSCHLMLGNTEILRGNFSLNVIQYPTFGEFDSALKHFDGKPPHVIFLIERSHLRINCSIRSLDNNNQVASPRFLINGFSPEDLCSNVKLTNQALCTMKKNLQILNELPRGVNRPVNEKKIQYYVRDIQALDKGTGKSMSHLLTCSASGSFKIPQKKLTVNAFTAINVLPRPQVNDFEDLPRDCDEGATDGSCRTGTPHSFHCKLKSSYLQAVKNEGVVVRKYWKVGSHTQFAIESLDKSAPARNYTNFTNNGDTLTISMIYNSEDSNTINELNPIKCVIKLYYPSYVDNTEMRNVEIFGSGMINPTTYSSKKSENLGFGPLIYSSDEDENMKHLTAYFRLEAAKISEAGMFMFAAIGISVLLLVIILVLLTLVIIHANRNKTTSYHIGQKEMDQGLDPILEFKEQQTFKEYHRKEEEPIKGSRWSMASSVVVKSQVGSILLDEEFENTSSYGKPVFVGDRTGNADF